MAAAACDLYPGTLLGGGRGTSLYFYYDLTFPFPFQQEFLPLIEERMRAIVREKRTICRREMIPSNAAELFDSHEQQEVTERLLAVSSATVQICQIGAMYDFCAEDFVEQLELPPWKLLEFYDPQIPGKKRVRIVGALAQEKTELKQIAKRPFPSEQSHLDRARLSPYFEPLDEPGLWMWLGRGEKIRAILSDIFRMHCVKQKIEVVSTPYSFFEGREEALWQLHLKDQKKGKVGELCWISPEQEGEGEGLFSTAACFTDRLFSPTPREKLLEKIISSLQSILKILKILHFEFDILLSVSCAGNQKERRFAVNLLEEALKKLGLAYETKQSYCKGEHARIQVQLFDALRRKWSASFVSIPLQTEAVVSSLFGSMERWIALLLEQKGAIPLRLMDEFRIEYCDDAKV